MYPAPYVPYGDLRRARYIPFGYYVVPLPLHDGDLGGGEAVELVDEAVDGVIGGGDVALEARVLFHASSNSVTSHSKISFYAVNSCV